ncbi:hypothetical protein H0H92_007404 [Tricholoma furcatifolium]|nr:hypothetical protein H0H92_007404 [Tricholoma furcatifolium]
MTRALEFYSGIGGLHLAFERSGVQGSVVQAFDWDQTACQVYSANHQAGIVQKVDITTLTAADLASYRADLWLLSPACQPYTVLNPNAKGASDPRAQSFLHLIQVVLPDLSVSKSLPARLLIENVGGFETSSTRQILLSTLRSLGYITVELLLTPLQFGIPNSRLRYYLLAKLKPLAFAHVPVHEESSEADVVWKHIPGHSAWIDPRLERLDVNDDYQRKQSPTQSIDSVRRIEEYLDDPDSSSAWPHPNAVPEKVLTKWGRLFDIVLPSSQRSCCFTRGYSQLVERAGSILQVNEELDTTETFDRFLDACSRDDSPNAVEILRPLQLRYFSSSELLRLFDFTPPHSSATFLWPSGISTKSKYRLIGNSVNVHVPRGKRTTEDMGLEAATKALLDAGITYDEVQNAFVGYCYGDSTSGQRALYNLGLTGIPVVNVNNNCSTGSAALFQANNSVKYGQTECSLALGFERMKPGSLGTNFPDRPSPTLLIGARSTELEEEFGENHGPGAPRMFGNGAQEYFKKYGGNVETLAKIASKNHKHSLNNPYSQFRDGWSVEQVLNAPKITAQLTKFMCSPTSDGAACCIVASEDFVRKHHLENQAIEIVAQALSTDTPVTFEGQSAMDVVGYTMSKNCADQVFKDAGFAEGQGRDQVGVVELHDCFAANELITYPALGLCAIDEAHKLVERGDNTYGGKFVVNPSGGLEAKGHPLGATGLGMHFYIMRAGPMQAQGLFDIPDKRGKYGLVHNVGLGGAVVVSLLRRPEFFKPGGEDGRTRLGYNHAHECRPVTMNDVDKVKSVHSSKYILQQAKL